MRNPILALWAATSFLLCSCAVKENRGPCPSYLTFDASAYFGVSDVAFVNLNAGNRIFKDTLYLGTGQTAAEWEAEKGEMTAYSFSNLWKSEERNGVVTIPEGEQADPLRASCHRFECYDETFGIDAKPNRQTALVRLRILNVEGIYPYDLQVAGDICGIDLKTLTPLDGPFRYDLDFDEYMMCEFYLPRQKRESRPEIKVFLDGDHIDTLPLHSWLESAGYDWSAEDLPDISLDYVHGQLKVIVNVQGWEHEDYEVIL